ncbi:ankyrin repeat-containing domain protein [Cercophora newfieldiana]|uniref:Ankyrin repeat-containing domain protein n=1 Tax=Cercophora newfieldiana TaxID=92897 RepID=A0AA39XTQ4_9PEZI|nr:ankyrin repeat-containing domain protein [Cercophora newfieldiana]
MADIVAGIAFAASVVQIIDVLAKTTRNVADFCRDVSDAPRICHRVRENLDLLKQLLEDIQSCADELENEVILPPATRQLLRSAAERTQQTLAIAQLTCQKASTTLNLGKTSAKVPGTGRRIVMVLKDKPALKRVQAELEEFDRLLLLVIQLANMRIALSHYQAFAASRKDIEKKDDSPAVAKPALPSPRPRHVAGGSFRYTVLGLGPALRWMGFYGEIAARSSPQHLLAASVYLGYKFPSWLWARSFDVEFGIFIPRLIRPQRRVPLNSPFLNACRNGDLWQMRQFLCDGVGLIGDRAMCNGVTPLLLAIEGGHVDAIAYLLEAGADPNIGDDDRILPVFFALGMNPRKSRYFIQFPPTRDTWLEILRLLVKHGASVHEVVAGRSLAMLDVVESRGRTQTLEFFHFLQGESYTDLPTTNLQYNSPVVNAIRSADTAVECLQFLRESAGVDFSRLAVDDQRSVLHYGAEFAIDASILEYLCASCDPSYINRQDARGWTPLHYAVCMDFFNSRGLEPLANARCLIQRGADPTLKSTARFPALCDGVVDEDIFSPLELCRAYDNTQRGSEYPKYEKFVAILEEYGHGVVEADEEPVFYDAVDYTSP